MGVKVSAAKEDIITEPATTKLNSRNRRPLVPSMNTMGRNTATSVTVVEMTAKKISFEPSMPALKGFMPLSILIYMFSVITMASSTTRPTESTTASMVSTFMENPATYITKNAPMSETGITIQGISVTRQSRRNRKMMMITSTNASYTVFFTSSIDARMNLVLSKP